MASEFFVHGISFEGTTSGKYYQWASAKDLDAGETTYLLLGASREFVDDHCDGKIEPKFEEDINSWKEKGSAIFDEKFHYVTYANSEDGKRGVLEFLKAKGKGFGY